jgi:integrase
MGRRVLTERFTKSLKPAKPGQRPIEWDALVPGLGIQSTDKGHHTFGVKTRWAGSKHPAWRAIGDRSIGVSNARSTARGWLEQNKSGVDPKTLKEEKRKAEDAKKLAASRVEQSIFAAVCEIFFVEYLQGRKLRQASRMERRIRNELIPHWDDLSVHAISRDHVEDLITAIVKRPAPRYAHSVFDDVKMIFNWMVDVVDRRKPYKLQVSPCDRIKPTRLIGPKNIRTRVLTDAELRSLWLAAEAVGYPFGDLVKMLLLTGCRLNEVAGARWPEFDDKLWTIPPARFKSNSMHRIPITDDLAALLAKLPRFTSGDFLFSNRFGKAPVSGFGHAKERIDAHMPADMPPWCFHDIRRTLRTRLSALRIDDKVAEMLIGHGKRGLDRVYDQHKFEPEIRDALTRWHALLRSIINPPDNVVSLPTRA